MQYQIPLVVTWEVDPTTVTPGAVSVAMHLRFGEAAVRLHVATYNRATNEIHGSAKLIKALKTYLPEKTAQTELLYGEEYIRLVVHLIENDAEVKACVQNESRGLSLLLTDRTRPRQFTEYAEDVPAAREAFHASHRDWRLIDIELATPSLALVGTQEYTITARPIAPSVSK